MNSKSKPNDKHNLNEIQDHIATVLQIDASKIKIKHKQDDSYRLKIHLTESQLSKLNLLKIVMKNDENETVYTSLGCAKHTSRMQPLCLVENDCMLCALSEPQKEFIKKQAELKKIQTYKEMMDKKVQSKAEKKKLSNELKHAERKLKHAYEELFNTVYEYYLALPKFELSVQNLIVDDHQLEYTTILGEVISIPFSDLFPEI